jgi:hypothetical protein
MSLIICPECGKEYSDRANACPNCACPNPHPGHTASYTDSSTTKSKNNSGTIVLCILLSVIFIVAAIYIYKFISYTYGVEEVYCGNYSEARHCLEGLNYQDSELILNDISFLEDLEEIVNYNLDRNFENTDYIETAKFSLNKLHKYKTTEFYTAGLDGMFNRYIEGLERIIASPDYETPASIQYEIIAGQYYCDYVVVELHDKIGFMQNSSEYAEVFTDLISREEAMLTAFEELNEKGHIPTRNGEFWYSQVKLYLRNDTKYRFDQTYVFSFYDYNGDKLLETVTVDVPGVEPYSDYTVCIEVPQRARNGYSVEYAYYYLDITNLD